MGKDMIDNFLAIIVFVVIVGLGFTVISSNTSFSILTDVAINQPTPFNITLAGNNPQTLLNVTNGSIEIPSSNYTFNLSQFFVQINDNTSFSGELVYAQYEDRQFEYMSGTIGAVALLVIVFAVIIFIRMQSRQKRGK